MNGFHFFQLFLGKNVFCFSCCSAASTPLSHIHPRWRSVSTYPRIHPLVLVAVSASNPLIEYPPSFLAFSFHACHKEKPPFLHPTKEMTMRQPKEDLLFKGLIPYIESLTGVVEVSWSQSKSASAQTISNFEQTNQVILPRDYVNFLMQTDGICLKWISSLYSSDDALGIIQINELAETSRNAFGSRFQDAFSIQNCEPFGSVYMTIPSRSSSVAESGDAYASSDTGIYFLDKESGEWIYITSSFSNYFRLMVSCLGIKGWQLAYKSKERLSWPQWTRNWLFFYCQDAAKIIARQLVSDRQKRGPRGDLADRDPLDHIQQQHRKVSKCQTRSNSTISMDRIAKTVQMWKEINGNPEKLSVEVLMERLQSHRLQ